MEQRIHDVMSAAAKVEEFDIEHVGKDGEGMPIGGDGLGEGGSNAGRGETLSDHLVVSDVEAVVVAVELEGIHLGVHRVDGEGQEEQNSSWMAASGFHNRWR